nr:MAG TPA: hypothetical protein [Caudoviricetes sp.]
MEVHSNDRMIRYKKREPAWLPLCNCICASTII